MFRLQRALPERYAHATPDELAAWIGEAKATLGPRVLILGHHYQRDEVMRWADARGDSFGLSRTAAQRRDADYIVFCGVHFMAESADILTAPEQQVILPDLNAGCSMADMADIDAVEDAWESLAAVTDIERVVPVTYMNSSAALKAFVGRHGGAVCTSSNARAVLSWALDPAGTGSAGATRSSSSPTSTSGATPAISSAGTSPTCGCGTPCSRWGASTTRTSRRPPCCCGRGTARCTSASGPSTWPPSGPSIPADWSWSTPSAPMTWSMVADEVGSTDFIIRAVDEAPSGSVIGVGTEIHLVKRLDDEHPDKTVVSLDPLVCPCSTMFRIDAAHLCWVLERLVEGEVVNRITVEPDVARWARCALERMLEIT